jgi:ribosomal protein S12
LSTEAAGIGGGCGGVGHDIRICDYAVVETTGGDWGAGIGGCYADGYSIEISGNADVTATGGNCGAGIGGGNEGEGNGITISESAKVTATGGECGAGIGGGNNKSGHDITISDNATVIATGVKYGAGIGGGQLGKGEKITVKGSATVIAIGGSAGAGIGGGNREIGEEIKIQDKAVVTVSGGKDTVIIDGIKYHVGYGAAIGTGSSADESYNPIDGTELPLNELITSEFAGDIRYYQHGTTAKEILEGTATRENCVTITFDANGGEGTMEPAVVTIDLPKALPANAFTIAGHSIDKWTVNQDGSGDSYKDEEKVAFAANTTLYVQWSDHVFENTVDEDCLVSGPTCTKGSVYYKSCKCGEKSTETFEAEDALDHDYKVVEGSAVDPTCTKAGKEADRKCSRCDATITGKEIAAAGHKWKAATGATPKTCEVCGLTEGDVISYIPTGGSTIEWESGDITLTFKRSEQDELCFANYKETQIDKKTTKVSAKAGSTIITIDEATLKALSAGEHTITVVFADATSDVKLVIKEPEVTEPEVKPTEPEKVESPKTGDGLPMGVVTAMALVALLGAAAVTVQRRRGAAE